MTCQLVKALYDFTAPDTKILSFKVNQWFVVIKATPATGEWMYVVNEMGKLGYVPSNYVSEFKMDDSQLLKFIDKIASLLDTKHNDQAITDRQVKHAQIKLAEYRCECVQSIFKKVHPQSIPEVDPSEEEENEISESDSKGNVVANNSRSNSNDSKLNSCQVTPSVASTQNSIKEKSEQMVSKSVVGKVEEQDKKENSVDSSLPTQTQVQTQPQSHSTTPTTPITIPDTLIPELIERVRITTDLNHSMCALTVKTVIACLGEMIPQWSTHCESMLKKLSNNHSSDASTSGIQSSDSINLKSTFKKLWWCKNDEQQRSWPVHEDEEIIKGYLNDIFQILSNANPGHIKDVICRNNYDNVHMLVTYFQMETRKSLRMIMYNIFLSLAGLFETIIPDYLLTSVMPNELAAEMQNYLNDEERWGRSAMVFTAIFSTGHKPPITIYEHINEDFITRHLDVIEGVDSQGNRIDCDIPPETSIAPLLSFNLHFDDPTSNLVLKALKNKRNCSKLTENLVSYLNWEEDITRLVPLSEKADESESHMERPNAALKMLIEMFGDDEVSKLFYYNDVRVVIDIIIRQLNNLPAGDKNRVNYLILTSHIMKNTCYAEEPHKCAELNKCFTDIMNHYCSTEKDKECVCQIKSQQPSLFK